MKCPKCESVLRVRQVYSTPSGQTKRTECESCGAVCTAVTVLVNTDPPFGKGAAALARRIRNGESIDRVLGKE